MEKAVKTLIVFFFFLQKKTFFKQIINHYPKSIRQHSPYIKWGDKKGSNFQDLGWQMGNK